MLLFNQTTESFIKRIRLYLHEIAQELGLDYRTSRIHIDQISYPLSLVIFEGESHLGFFDPHTYRLGLNNKLLYCANSQVIRDILKHELAHFLTFIHFPKAEHPHGQEFKNICLRYRLPDEVSKATLDLDLANESTLDLRSEKVLSTVKKLLALASSQNEFEAEAATLKANNLLLKHNLDLINLRKSEGNPLKDNTYAHTVLSSKRQSAKMHAIYQILTSFLVYPVFLQGKEGVRLEVIGSRANVELAEYVANFLDGHLEELWHKAQKSSPHLKGKSAKNSFFKGVATGYSNKIQEEHKNPEMSKALVLLNRDLKERVAQVYSRLGSSRSNSSFCHESHSQGVKSGSRLSINPALPSAKNGIKKLLTFSRD